ncbi:MAG: hypothetical protein EOO04_15565 [Chitinophagaceae bacterium]|nr:MAG: hypothetical protein EOO04_15565 [Chitinophagaceae bacterium]
MNQVFDFNRFILLVSKHWSENRKKYLLGLIAIAGMLFFWYSFVLIFDSRRIIALDTQLMTYFFGLAVMGCFFGSMLFNEMSSGPKAMNYLSFPASHLEKLVCGLLYGVLFFFIAYTVIFYIVDFAMVSVGNSLTPEPGILSEGLAQPAKVINLFGAKSDKPGIEGSIPEVFRIFVLIYLAIQSAYILGSVYFAKFSFIKTTIALACIALVFTLFVAKILYPMLPEGGDYNSLTSLSVYTEGSPGNAKLVALPEWIDDTLQFILKFAFAPIFWIVTYFRFKEKEV